MEAARRRPVSGAWPDWLEDSEIPFAEAVNRGHKHLLSIALGEVD